MQKYGITWPDTANNVSIELKCFRHWGEDEYMSRQPKWRHLRNAITSLWPEGTKTPYISHHWTDYRIKSFCEDKFSTWWSATSLGKTTDAAVLALVLWLADPENTTVRVCSTTLAMLEQRIWGEVLRYYRAYESVFPGRYYARDKKIQCGDSERSGIFGIPVLRGTVEETLGAVFGVHNKYNYFFVDEMQFTRQAIVDGFLNAKIGLESKFLGLGNPWTKMDPLGLASKPKEGWDSISSAHKCWETDKGRCHYFSGFNSPGIKEPDKFYFMLKQEDIDEAKEDPGPESPLFQSQIVGFMPKDNASESVMTQSFAQQFHLQDKVIWMEPPMMFAGFDPAFTIDGDRAILYFWGLGYTNQGTMVAQEEEVMDVKYKVSSDNRSFEYELADEVISACKRKGVPARRFGIDITGQQTAMASIIEELWEKGIYRVQFGGSPDDEENKEQYRNRVTELYYNFRALARADMIRGISTDVLLDFTERKIVYDNRKIQVEPKKEMKLRTKRSPDKGDGAIIGTAVMWEKNGLRPGNVRNLTVGGRKENRNLKLDIDSDPDNYLSQEL